MSRLFLILGDQLHPDPHPLLADFNPTQDRLMMIEAPVEATHVWSHKARIAVFLAGMRHRATAFQEAGIPLEYLHLGTHPHADLASALAAAIRATPTRAVVMLEAGDHRVQESLQQTCDVAGCPLLIRPDPHFLCSLDDFMAWAGDKPSLRLEFFYRWQRKRHHILMQDGEPLGGQWNFDAENRQAFGRHGPGSVPAPLRFTPDATTQKVLADVEQHFPHHPGSLARFGWPVTPAQAKAALDDFVHHRLPAFGQWQDAMWDDEAFLWHSLLSTALNLKLIAPRTVIDAVLTAHAAGRVPLPAAEGFIRQILGWREFVRGIYWRQMPGLAQANQYGHDTPLPAWFWTGKTQARCLSATIRQTLEYGYAHHIQRLMVTGNFALIAGLNPAQVADWYLAVYVDAVDWVEAPNTLGMALQAWPGMTSKPYCASGAYIKRMSNYCQGCRYQPQQRTGPDACPFTTFYWDFLNRHAARFRQNPRMAMPLKNLERLEPAERETIRTQAEMLRRRLDTL